MSTESPALDWNKSGGIIPAVIQDADDDTVLMLGYLSPESLQDTLKTRRVVFYSRSRQELWTKGEVSGNFLELVDLRHDCDADTLLIRVRPAGPVCHRGTRSCFAETAGDDRGLAFLARLERIIRERDRSGSPGSYTARLLAAQPHQIGQKVGEEAVELALAAVCRSDSAVLGEAADLLYHLMVLLQKRGLSLGQVVSCLASRHEDGRSMI